jgi:hypothetical protein
MSDDVDNHGDLDDQLRRAMATLDREAPPGYFDTLSARTLARLDDAEVPEASEIHAAPGDVREPGEPRDEDSGLQDIRTLASETKARLSSRRSSQDLLREADDARAAASASWKSVALPDPARVVALPPATPPALPPAISSPPAGTTGIVDEIARVARDAKAVHAQAVAVAAERRRRARRTMAVLGVGVAAAAGALIFVSAERRDQVPASQRVRALPSTASTADPEKSTPIVTPIKPIVTAIEPPAAGSGAAQDPGALPSKRDDGAGPHVVAAGDPGAAVPRGKPIATKGGGSSGGGARPIGKMGKKAYRDVSANAAADNALAGSPPEADHAAAGALGQQGAGQGAGSSAGSAGSAQDDHGDPAFDALWNATGAHAPNPGKPRLDRTSLSSDDIKRGMAGVATRAKACFDGTQGLAALRLSVAPSGQVQKVTVSGLFAGTAVGACVERAVMSAVFPPWDGGPQSFGYSYLLAE